MPTPVDFVRRFATLDDGDLAQVDDILLSEAFGLRRGMGWDAVLGSWRILLLSAGGSGKSFECRAEARRRNERGETAFVIELAELAKGDWVASPKEAARYQQWLMADDEVAVVFLDSYDELKLTQGSFTTALKRAAQLLGDRLHRVRIVLTSRPRPVDRALFAELLPYRPRQPPPSAAHFADAAMARGKDRKPPDHPPSIAVGLLPLDETDIRALATSKGVTDADAFAEALRTADMRRFADRPQGVIELARAWQKLGGFGTYHEQIEFDVRARLQPGKDRIDHPIADDRAYDGAYRLALAELLTGKLTIRYDDGHDVDLEGTGLDPVPLLPGWPADDWKALLQRPLFEYAGYGRVRFHNRAATEYLAARRLETLLSANPARRRVARQLFAKTAQGASVVRPGMRGAVAWLALTQDWVLAETLDREPELLINQGDPQTLSLDDKQRVVRAMVARHGPGGWRGLGIEAIQIRRMADAGLAPLILELYATIENGEVRELLLELAEAGRLSATADLAWSVLNNGRADYGERVQALKTLVAVDDARLPDLAEALARHDPRFQDRLARIATAILFPDRIDGDRLARTLTWLPNSKGSATGLGWLLPQRLKEARISPSSRRALVAALFPVVGEGFRFDTQSYGYRCDRPHLVPLLATLAAHVTTDGDGVGDLAPAIALAARLHRDTHDDDMPEETLREALATASSALRSAVFSADAAQVDRALTGSDRRDKRFELSFRGALLLGEADRGWMEVRLADAAIPRFERGCLAQALMHLAAASADRTARLTALQPLVAADPELASELEAALAPAAANREVRRMHLCQERQKKQSQRRDAKAWVSWVGFWREVEDAPYPAFGAERLPNTVWNLDQAMRRADIARDEDAWRGDALATLFTPPAVARIRAAFMPYWRREKPTLWFERAAGQENITYVRWNAGLAGIAAEAETEGWAVALSADEADTAARYAPLHLNACPPWLDALADAHWPAVDAVIGGLLDRELAAPATENGWSTMLSNLSHASPALARRFLPRLRTWLADTGGQARAGDDEAGGAARTARVVEMLLNFGDEHDRAELRRRAADALNTGNSAPFERIWLALLFALDPLVATDVLERLCHGIVVTRVSAAGLWLALLFGDRQQRFGAKLRDPAFTPPLLLRLVRFAYEHVRHDDDNQHDGAYSPDDRDDAERARDALLSALLRASGPEAWQAKVAIANDPALAMTRDRLLVIANEGAAEEAQGASLDEQAVAAFERGNDVAPRSHAQMAALIGDRLDEIEDWLSGDTSQRELWAMVTLERVMRRALADRLTLLAAGAYSVGQEEVTAEEKETDLRLRSTATAIVGVVELKLAEQGWSARDLCDRLKTQLVDKYLAPEDRRAGCLLVTRTTKTGWQHPETGATLDFASLIAMLQDEADQMVAALPGQLHLLVRGLDLAPRLASGKPSVGVGKPTQT